MSANGEMGPKPRCRFQWQSNDGVSHACMRALGHETTQNEPADLHICNCLTTHRA